MVSLKYTSESVLILPISYSPIMNSSLNSSSCNSSTLNNELSYPLSMKTFWNVSFISLTNVLQYLEEFLKDSGKIITLIKPQFEVGREKIGKNGIVTNPEYHDEAIKKVIKYADSKNFKLIDITDSPISGAKGNKEFLGLFSIKK